MVYLPTYTIQINQMQVNIPYMDPMGNDVQSAAGMNWWKVAQAL